jgi:asparagine synthase (glutamine-hydrolysing)
MFNRAGEVTPDDRSLVGRMASVIAHRGPDDSGCYAKGPIALGHRRLSVIDLSANGHQPMSNEDGSVWITFNGEIYNFTELKSKHRLAEKGHVFRSATDTEVLIHLYEEIGLKMLDELDGMFAFGIWDAHSRELHLCRDRYGIKPLFYCWQGFRFFSKILRCRVG